MKTAGILIFIFFQALLLEASHITGGEFQLIHIEGNTYRLNLNIYFDVINGNSGARDNQANVRIYRKSDNVTMMDVTLPFISQSRIEYFQLDCSNGEVITDKLIYSSTITLSESVFNDPEGYYVVWERCCRNYTLTNIISTDPNTGGVHAGQTFYLEFPPVTKSGEPFVNSSPQLNLPFNDYACPNRPYWIDFVGFDADGDSLAYTLVTPLSTHNAVAIPNGGPGAAPFPVVTWQSPFNVNNIMNGAPDLKVSDEGFLTVTPTQQGLYAFAIKCEEFRDSEKIGEVFRDFQLLVLGSCPVADPPKIVGRKLNEVGFNYPDILSVTFPNTVTDEDRCIEVQISDPDALKVDDNFTENIWLKAIPLNFKTSKNLNEVLPTLSSATLLNGSVASFMICFDQCPYVENEYFKIGVIVFDDACALPLSDTLEIEVGIVPPHNNSPVIMTSGNNIPSITINKDEGIGQNITIPIEGIDTDNRTLSIHIIPKGGFDLSKAGMSFTTPNTSVDGNVTTAFNWNLDCSSDDLDFSEGKTISLLGEAIVKQYKVRVIVEDVDDCSWEGKDTLEMELNIRFPEQISANVFQVDHDEKLDSLKYNFNLGDEIQLDIKATGNSLDHLNLFALGANFDLDNYGVKFENNTNQAGSDNSITNTLQWMLEPDRFKLNEQDSFRIYFVTKDLDRCNFSSTDTLLIDFLFDEIILSIETKYVRSTGISLYPIPANKIIFIKLAKEKNQDIKFSIFNLKGEKVEILNSVKMNNSGYELTISENLVPGIYILNTISGNDNYSNRLIID